MAQILNKESSHFVSDMRIELQKYPQDEKHSLFCMPRQSDSL